MDFRCRTGIPTCQFDNFKPVFGLFVSDPSVGLILRIDHEWPAPTAHDEDGVFGGEIVTREAVVIPRADFNGIRADAYQIAVVTHGNL